MSSSTNWGTSQVFAVLSSKWSRLGGWWQIAMSNTWGALGYGGLAGQCEAAVCETTTFQLSYIDLNRNGPKRLDQRCCQERKSLQ